MTVADQKAVSRLDIAHQCATRRHQIAARRNEALRRMPLQPTYLRDPENTIIPPTLDPATILELLRIGGTITREQVRIAWQAYPQERPMIEERADVLSDGWAA